MIDCTTSICSFPSRMHIRSVDCFIDLVSPSATLSALRTKPMSKISEKRNCSRAAAMPSMGHFCEVRHPSDITSNRQLQSINNCNGTFFSTVWSTFFEIITAASLMSGNDVTSLAIAEQVMRRDLYDLKRYHALLPFAPYMKMICPSCIENIFVAGKWCVWKPNNSCSLQVKF